MKTPAAQQSSGDAFLRFSACKVLLAVGDLLIINGALVLTFAFRPDFGLSRFSFWQHAPWLLLLSALWLAIGLVLDIYNLARAASAAHSLWATGSTLLLTSLVYLLVFFLIPTRPSRGLEPLLLPGLALAGLTVWRVSCAKGFVQPHFHQRVLIIGAGWSGQTLAQAIAATGDGAGNP